MTDNPAPRFRPGIATLGFVAIAAGVPATLMLLLPSDRPADDHGGIVVPAGGDRAQALPPPPSTPLAKATPAPAPVLTMVMADGKRSSARFHMPDGTWRTLRIGKELQAGWKLREVTSGAAIFATPAGDLRFRLSGVAVSADADGAGRGAPKEVRAPPPPAHDAEGYPIVRCSDPEC